MQWNFCGIILPVNKLVKKIAAPAGYFFTEGSEIIFLLI